MHAQPSPASTLAPHHGPDLVARAVPLSGPNVLKHATQHAWQHAEALLAERRHAWECVPADLRQLHSAC